MRFKLPNTGKRTHGMSFNNKSASPLERKFYTAWNNMRSRCYNPGNDKQGNYYFRGIKVCDRWQVFENFRDDMWDEFQKHEGKRSLERIDNDGNYEPSNCRWATKLEQMNNMRTNLRIELFGRTENLIWWSRFTGIGRTTIRQRLDSGWTPEDALLTSPHYIGRRASVKRETTP